MSSRNKIQGGKAADARAAISEPFADVVRSVVRGELEDCLRGPLRELLRTELAAALQGTTPSGTAGGPLAGGGGGDSTVPSRCGAEAVVQTSDSDGDGQQSPRARGAEREESQEDYADTHMVSSLKRPSARPSLNSSLGTDDDANLSELRRKIISKARALLERLRRRAWWLDEEPQRSGRLAQLMDGPGFELLMGAVIVLNLWFMVHDANVKIRDPADRSMLAADVVFLVIYCSEVALKLAVHRVWYFTGAHWKMNALDLFVVVSECAALVLGTALRLSFMKVFRFLKLAKVIKAFRLMDNLKYLHAFMTCIQGSFTSFMWSVVMLFSVYGVFSLLFMQVITTHIDTTGEALDDTAFGELFGSVDRSVKTLFMVTTGGDDWISTYEVIEETGPIGSFVFLAFIAFVNLNLLNIILGIFVDSAMKVLSPDSYTLAREYVRRERQHAAELTSLCKAVDTDRSGKLTQEQFMLGLTKQRLPKLLIMMGLQKHHILEFFQSLAKASHDDGQVDITEFVEGCMLLKGTSTNFDLHKLRAETQIAHTKIIHLLQDISVPGRRAAIAAAEAPGSPSSPSPWPPPPRRPQGAA